MPRRVPAVALALALAVPGLALAQAPSESLFRSYVAGAPAPAAFALDAPAAFASGGGAGGAGDAEERDSEEATQPGWFAGNQRYAVGGVAALGAGVALARHVSGGSAAAAAGAAGGDQLAMPTAFGLGGTLPPGLTLDPAVSPAVIVNPEPGTVLLLATGLGGLLVVARRRRRS